MKKTLLKSLFFLFSILFANSMFSQSNDWIQYYSSDDAKISYKYITCEYKEQFNQEHIILKVENLSNQTINIQWDQELWYDNECITCKQNSEEYRITINTQEGETLIGSCMKASQLRLFSRFTDKLSDMPGINNIVKLTKFELKNITITYE